MKKLSPIFVLGTLLSACASTTGPASASAYPAHWWAPVPTEGAPAWEILPQAANPDAGEVILSKRNELGLLSNFAPTPFELEGMTYASVEGFWQMMKYPEGPKDPRNRPGLRWPHTREQVAAMTAFEAKAAGDAAEAIMRKEKIDWVSYRGRRMQYRESAKGDFYQLILAAEWAKVRQNENVRAVLLKTGTLRLLPDHHQEATAPPAWKYFEIWMEIRAQLVAEAAHD